METTKPQLTQLRQFDLAKILLNPEKGDLNKNGFTMKTVQTWLNDIQYGWEESNHTLPYPQLIKLAKRLELASQFVIRTKTSSTEFQASSYQIKLRNDD